MITLESAQDFIDADLARRAAGQEPLLTEAGQAVLMRVVVILKPMPQLEIDAILRGTVERRTKDVKPLALPGERLAAVRKLVEGKQHA
jgi:hypothetical protein